MDERLLTSFVAVYRTGSFIEASEQLNVSQSALSRRLAELQSQLGVTLFEPDGRGIRRTTDAERLLPHALRAWQSISDFKNAAKADVGEVAIPIAIAATAHTIDSVIASHVVSYRRTRPNIEISLVEAGGAEVEQLVLSGKASMGLSARPNIEAGLSELVIARRNFLAVSTEPFSQRQMRHGIDLKALCRRDLVMFDRRFQSRLIIDAAIRLLDLSPKIVHESGAAGVIMALAAAGMGTGILLSNTTTNLPTARIITQGTPLGLDLTAVWEPTSPYCNEIEEFATSLKTAWPALSAAGPK
jgi:DNA-binding transcriptional LysR family regulator